MQYTRIDRSHHVFNLLSLQSGYYGLLLQSISLPPFFCHSAHLDGKTPNPTRRTCHSALGQEKIMVPRDLVSLQIYISSHGWTLSPLDSLTTHVSPTHDDRPSLLYLKSATSIESEESNPCPYKQLSEILLLIIFDTYPEVELLITQQFYL